MFTVGWGHKDTGSGKRLIYWRPFLSESLRGLTDCAVRIYEKKGYQEIAMRAQGSLDILEETLTRLLQSTSESNASEFTCNFIVDRNAVARLIVEIAKEVLRLHEQGLIHGDLKPSNVLVTEKGPVLIDTLFLKPGELSPAMTPGWTAPEQVILQPVSYATDIYPLALMFVHLLNGTLTGEVRTYVIPGERIVRVFISPTIYFEPHSPIIAQESREYWLDFLEEYLRFEASDRPQTMQEFIETAMQIINDYPPQGQVVLRLPSVQNRELAVVPGGRETVVSVLEDVYRMEELVADGGARLGVDTLEALGILQSR